MRGRKRHTVKQYRYSLHASAILISEQYLYVKTRPLTASIAEPMLTKNVEQVLFIKIAIT